MVHLKIVILYKEQNNEEDSKKEALQTCLSSEDWNNFFAEFQFDDDGALPGTSS